MLRLLLIDENLVFLQALDKALRRFPDVRVVGRAAYAPEGLRLAIELKPDLVLVDMAMRDLDGIELTRRLRTQQPEAAVVVISIHRGADFERAALSAGAIAFVDKFNLLGALPNLFKRLDVAAPRPIQHGEAAR